MKNTIIETINGLKIAKDEREKSLLDIQTKDYTQIVAEYKAKLDEELKAKLTAYVDNIENDRSQNANKLSHELEIINELSAEFGNKLKEIELAETSNATAVETEIVATNEIETSNATVVEQPITNLTSPQ
jgi:hypothetical protein